MKENLKGILKKEVQKEVLKYSKKRQYFRKQEWKKVLQSNIEDLNLEYIKKGNLRSTVNGKYKIEVNKEILLQDAQWEINKSNKNTYVTMPKTFNKIKSNDYLIKSILLLVEVLVFKTGRTLEVEGFLEDYLESNFEEISSNRIEEVNELLSIFEESEREEIEEKLLNYSEIELKEEIFLEKIKEEKQDEYDLFKEKKEVLKDCKLIKKEVLKLFMESLEKYETRAFESIFDILEEDFKLEDKLYTDKEYEVIVVNNLESFFEKAQKKAQIMHREEKKEVFFRGQINSFWSLEAGIFRNNLIKYEKEMYLDILSKVPFDFRNSNVYENLLTIQHYGGATRLLDITQNPLIGLFFACYDEFGSEKEEDGKVFLFAEKLENIKHFNSDKVQVVSNLTRMNCQFLGITSREREVLSLNILGEIESSSKIENFRYRDPKLREEMHDLDIGDPKCEDLSHLKHYIGDYKPHFRDIINIEDLFETYIVKGVMSNGRIEKQNGDFILLGAKEDEGNKFLIDKIKAPEIIQKKKIVFIIEAQHKEEILSDLKSIDIHEGTVYPELFNKIKAIKSSWQKR